MALEKYGTLSFAQVVKPAIQAAGGFAPGDEFSDFLKDLLEYHRRWTDSFWFFYPTGRAPLRGDSLELPTLAKTFESLAEAETKAQGSREQKIQAVHDYFYKGPIAHKLADASAALDGLITYDDLANFHAEVDQPRSTEYRGYTIWKPGFWTQGPVLLETLNLLEGYQLEPMRHNYPEYLHTVIEATKLAFADRDQYYGDPKFSKIPEATLLSKEYAAERRKLIEVGKASEVSRPGQLNASAPAQGGGGVSTNKDTTSIDIVDQDGNAFSATPSGAWIPSVIAGDTGIPFSVRLESFVLTPNHANQLAPGKRPRVTLSPTIVTKGDKLIGVLSTPGGDNQDQALLQVLLNIIDFNMPPQQAVEAARFTSQHFYSSFGYHELYPAVVKFENRIPDSIATVLRQRGHKIDYEEAWSNSSAPVVIWMRDGWSKGVVLEGGADPRRNRVIFAR